MARAVSVMPTLAKREPIIRNRVSPLRLALALNALLGGMILLPAVNGNPGLEWSVAGAAGALLIFLALLNRQVSKSGRQLYYEYVPRPVHYVQLTMHSSIYAYWGWYWREVYHYLPLILVQIVFAYVLDMLVCWSRRDKWILGFGPFPIVLSTNLFLWFKPDWFYLQFLMLATGVLCKEFITWNREGRKTHIFNPSAIALFIFSIALIATHSTPISWGEEIAVSFDRPPQIYVEIFLLGLVVQALFSVTLVTLSAATALYVLNVAYTGSTGLYFFVDTNIPAAVFLGLHLLVTDPATSPRRSFGKVVFGAGYGVAVFGLYWLLGAIGAPTFYDKLLCVPPLNLTVRALDRVSAFLEARIRMPAWTPRQANLAHMAVWICLFAVMFTTGFVQGRHPGASLEFWRGHCESGQSAACVSWVRLMNISCNHGSGGACMMSGIASNEGRLIPRDLAEAGKDFAHGCELGIKDGCNALVRVVEESRGDAFQKACDTGDGESCFLLGSLYHAGRGVPQDFTRAVDLFRRSCSMGWWRGCGGLAECFRAGKGVAADDAQALGNLDRACRNGIAPSCFSAAQMYHGRNEETTARSRLRQGCELSTRFVESSAAYFREGSPARAAAVPSVCGTPQ
jgi:hypothetical protein